MPLCVVRRTNAQRIEPTGRAIGNALETLGERIFLWNICSLHSHKPGVPLSNNEHTKAGTRLGRRPLMALLDLLQPRCILALGNRAHKEPRALGVESIKLTHPAARGEKRQLFPHEVRGHYGINRGVTPGRPLG